MPVRLQFNSPSRGSSVRKGGVPRCFVELPRGVFPVQPGSGPRLGVPQRPRSGVDVVLVHCGDARVENSRTSVRAGVQDHYKRHGNEERFCFLLPQGDAHVLPLLLQRANPPDAVRYRFLQPPGDAHLLPLHRADHVSADAVRYRFLQPPGDAYVLPLYSAGHNPADAVRFPLLHPGGDSCFLPLLRTAVPRGELPLHPPRRRLLLLLVRLDSFRVDLLPLCHPIRHPALLLPV